MGLATAGECLQSRAEMLRDYRSAIDHLGLRPDETNIFLGAWIERCWVSWDPLVILQTNLHTIVMN